MSTKNKKYSDQPILVRALNLITNKVIAEGNNTLEVIKEAEKSGEDFILDFETNPEYSFIF